MCVCACVCACVYACVRVINKLVLGYTCVILSVHHVLDPCGIVSLLMLLLKAHHVSACFSQSRHCYSHLTVKYFL